MGLPRNYDPEYKVFASSHVGSNGPVTTGFDKPYNYASWLEYYGLPYYDVPGVVTLLDLKDPEKAARFGKVYGERQSNSDTVSNLYCASLAVNAYMLTGDTQYRDFVLDYVGAWRKRAENCEIMPDNAGPHGIVGETMGGRFYGSRYGWTHPHGYGTVNDAVIVGCEAERFFTGDKHSIDTARSIIETLISRYGVPSPDGGIIFPTKRADNGSIIEYKHNPDAPFVEPAQVADEPGYVRFQQRDGWYEYGYANTDHLAHICAASFDPADVEWLEKIASPQTLSVTPERWGGKSKANNHGGLPGIWPDTIPNIPKK